MKSAPSSRSAGRVLVVEDERDVAELLRYNLAKDGYDVVVAATGSDAVKQAHDGKLAAISMARKLARRCYHTLRNMDPEVVYAMPA